MVKVTRFLLIVVYIGYLVNVGLFLMMVPWSRAWGALVTQLPASASVLFDLPWFRGLLSAFGVLHLLLVVWELMHPTLLTPPEPSQLESQNLHQS